MVVALTEQATRELASFIEELALEPRLATTIVSEMVTAGLHEDLERWRNRFGNELQEG